MIIFEKFTKVRVDLLHVRKTFNKRASYIDKFILLKKNYGILFCLIVSLLFAFCACSKEKTLIAPAVPAMPAKDTMMTNDTTTASPSGAKFLALGDSYTIGQNVVDSERFPAQTVQLLRTQNIHINDPEYIATTGWTTTNLISAINLQTPAKDFDIVTLLIGVNDQFQSRDTTDYRGHFTELLNEAINFAGSRKQRVFVVSIPDYSVTPFVAASDKARVSIQIDKFNAINKDVTLQNGITYIDITPSSRKAADDPSLIADDGLHPSGKEYAVWANMLVPLIKKVLIADYTD